MSAHTDLKIKHRRHLDAAHADWATTEEEPPGSAFSWRGRMF
jgi:hypothetical protein